MQWHTITLPFNEYQYTSAFLAKAESFGKIWWFYYLSTQLSNNGETIDMQFH
jgi:hypothetical protein